MKKCHCSASKEESDSAQGFMNFSGLGIGVLLFFVSALPATSQTSDISVRGTVVEAGSGTPVARAKLTITRMVSGNARSTEILTNALGQYELNATGPVAVDDAEVPERDAYWVEPAYPNPLSAGSVGLRLRYGTPSGEREEAELEMFDVLGRRIAPENGLSSGMYFYRVRFEDGVSMTRSIVVVGSGPVVVNLLHEGDGLGSSSAASSMGAFGKMLADAEFVVEKDGLITIESSRSLADGETNTVDFTMNVAPPPTAVFSVSGSLVVGQNTVFDASASAGASGEELSFSWSFGDGRRGGGANISHSFSAAGNYTVILTARGAHGATAATSSQVTIAGAPPPAREDGVVEVLVFDPVENPVQGVHVAVPNRGISAVTDASGIAMLTGLDVGVTVALKFTRHGYTAQHARVDIPVNPTNPVRAEVVMRLRDELLPREDAEDGFATTGRDGARVEIPVDGLVFPDGSPVTGSVARSITPINVTVPTQRATFPGVFEGTTGAGQDGILLSYGAAEFVFEKDGQELQLAPGKVAVIEIPMYTEGAQIGDRIPLWSMDTATGRWVQEGEGVVVEAPGSAVGMALRAQVSHFSWWNCDDFVDEGVFTTAVRCEKDDGSNQPVDCWVKSSTSADPWDPADGPLYEVRVFVEAAGYDLIFPANSLTPVSGVAVLENGEVWRGATFVDPDNPGATVIPLRRTQGGGTSTPIGLPADIEETFDAAAETDLYTFQGTAGQLIFLSAIASRGASVSLLEPGGASIAGGPFGNTQRHRSFTTLPSEGTYTVRATSVNDPGQYWLSVKPLAELQLPYSSTTEALLYRYSENAYLVSGEALSVLGVVVAGSQRPFLDFCTLDVECGEVFSGGSIYEALGASVLPASGSFAFVVGASASGSYTMRVQGPDGSLPESANYSATLATSDVGVWTFDAAPGSLVNVGLPPDAAGTGVGASVYGYDVAAGRVRNARLTPVGYQMVLANSPSVPLDAPYFVFLTANRSAPPSGQYTFGYSQPTTEPLSFDAMGRAVLSGSLAIHGQHIFASFDAGSGDGLEAAMKPGSGNNPSDILLVNILRPADLTIIAAADYSFLSSDVGASASTRITQAGSYAAAVSSSIYDVGDFELLVNKVQSGSTFTVEGDEACVGSNTTSLTAAAAAVQDGGTITLCNGRHRVLSSGQVLASGVTVQGESGDAVVEALSTGGAMVLGANADISVRGFRFVSTEQVVLVGEDRVPPYTGYPEVLVEDIVQSAADGSPSPGTLLAGGLGRATVRNIQGGGAIDVRLIEQNASFVFENSVLLASLDARCQAGYGCTAIVDNVQVVDGLFERFSTLSITGTTFEGGDIRVTSVGESIISGNTFTPGTVPGTNMLIAGGGEITIRENTLVGEISVAAGAGPVVIEGNRMTLNPQLASTGARVFQLRHLTSGGPASVTVRNNVVDNAAAGAYSGIAAIIEVSQADLYSSIEFYNNTMRTAPGTVLTKPAVLVTTQNSVAGPLPVTFVNNVLQGVGGTAVSLPPGTTIDSDYNLFWGYAATYAGGATSTGGNDLIEPADPENPPPLFANDLLEMDPDSPAVDAGAGPGAYPGVPDVDFDGVSRPQGGVYDIGAYER